MDSVEEAAAGEGFDVVEALREVCRRVVRMEVRLEALEAGQPQSSTPVSDRGQGKAAPAAELGAARSQARKVVRK